MGNICIKSITSATKTYKNTDGIAPFTGLAVQVNRKGWIKACKSEGKYALDAISDLNEVERSSTYIVFMFTSPDMRMSQETKITLMKHRLGSLIVEPVVTVFNPVVMVVGDLIERVEYNDDYGTLSQGGFDDIRDDDF